MALLAGCVSRLGALSGTAGRLMSNRLASSIDGCTRAVAGAYSRSMLPFEPLSGLATKPLTQSLAGSRGFASSTQSRLSAARDDDIGPGSMNETIEQVRERIFGTHVGNGMRSGRKVVRRKMIGQQIAEYYPEDMSRMDPFMLDYNSEAAKLKLERLRRRGKAPPKKGAGKRSKR